MNSTTDLSITEPAGGAALLMELEARPAEKKSQLPAPELRSFLEGKNYFAQELLGAHICEQENPGVRFAVWAPNAKAVQVFGDFNLSSSNGAATHLECESGVWHGFIAGAKKGDRYKFHVVSANGREMDKSDPFAFHAEAPPHTASVIWDLRHTWGDEDWLRRRRHWNAERSPLSIYELHLGSWRCVPEENNRSLNYRETAPRLAEYVTRLGFTHVELLPNTKHPFSGSCGCQTSGYFAPASRYGTPDDFKYFVDCLHQCGIGVILDWAPSHFPTADHGLACFDGTWLFEHADTPNGLHPDWQGAVFNYGRPEVRSFLISSALFWIEQYHIDGLRLDAVTSMLYSDYQKSGGWIPNRYGGNENLEAIDFLRELNHVIAEKHPDVMTIAEETSAWRNVSRPASIGGLGFNMKWDKGWMHDTLRYFKRGRLHRKHYHSELPFRTAYAFTENFVLPLSHDEVVHGKGNLSDKMAGNEWQQYANLRLLYGYMFGQPGKKLFFMGAEAGQCPEWSHESSVEWPVENQPLHVGVQKLVADLNRIYQNQPALHELDFSPEGFEWVDHQDRQNTTLTFVRKSHDGSCFILIALNFAPVPRRNYRVGVPRAGWWQEILNTDARDYGGSGQGNCGGLNAESAPWHRRPFSLSLTLPPLAAVFFANNI